MLRAFRSLLILVLFLQASPIFAFGYRLHVLATKIAESHLTPDTKTEVYRLLGVVKAKLDASYQKADNTDRPIVAELGPLKTDFERASLYLDLIRSKERKTATWHYVNVLLDDDAYNPNYDKERIHVVARVEDVAKIVFDKTLSDEVRGEALLWLIHLVEDLHVPLHVCSNRDRGGNSLKIRYYYPGKTITQATNLHAVWDYLMLDVYSRDSEKCFELVASFDTEENRKLWMQGTPVSWANEGIALAKKAYHHPVEDRLIEQDDILESRYQTIHLPEVATCCCKSGLRLAFLLNEGLK